MLVARCYGSFSNIREPARARMGLRCLTFGSVTEWIEANTFALDSSFRPSAIWVP
jgi:hypothetical protein